jgi:hypothetical protein
MRLTLAALIFLIASASAEIVSVAHPDVMAERGQTIVWTAAMQAAFDRLIGAKASMHFEKVTPDNPLIDRMRAFRWDETKTLPKDGWFALSGRATPALAKEATTAWRNMAGSNEPEIKFSDAPGTLAAVVGISRDFQFRKAFKPSADTGLMWKGEPEPLKFFGIRSTEAGDYAENVRVLAWHPVKRMQALQLMAKEGDDTMVLYMPEEAQNMLEAVTWVKAWRNEWDKQRGDGLSWDDPRLHEKDDLRIPEIDLDAEASLADSFAGAIQFKGVSIPYRVGRADTMTRLQVDATGVKFSSKAEMGVDPFGDLPPPPQPKPRRFWFDKPFFLFLWRDGADLPYAAVWFGDTSSFKSMEL